MSLPEEFKCVVTTWDYIYDLCRDVSREVKDSGFEPEVIVALARGGWFAGRVLCDFLGLDDLESLKIEHYVGTAATKEGAEVKYPVADKAVKNKDVLLVDDITDTGQSLIEATNYLNEQNPSDYRTATLQYLQSSKADPDYIGEELDEWAWIIYPWNFIEDMIDLIQQLMDKEDVERISKKEIRKGLKKYNQIDPLWFEIAQPDRLEEVLEEMEFRGILEKDGNEWVMC
ncbi:MAG: Hypoxanthine phosphoribosyltransferase [Candidatus Methanohalarchaeum thermophilum]|uniref:Hypoxanthine phosphoribosyltransferase n=1 Tax=Methanohalarchaeum thermophilum TaxID=1903181 RepID=A0A1Q6DXT8_METT1|nr:MAG: Hypoxanthine phosphoribosyltransferase [Candidatus Methanohalarchaeum thermophilum]